MTPPLELRALCLQLTSTPIPELPRLLPRLLLYILQCRAPLSHANANQSDASASFVLVHKLKTQLSALLNGKSPEGRFAAVVMIKCVVEVGGWEVLRGSKPWIHGLLSVLVKPDPFISKELCIITLTKIYYLAYQYPTLVREITTPTLPTYITSCLNLISSPFHSVPELQCSSIKIVFQSFATLLPRHATFYRPFLSQIRSATRPYLAPTISDGMFVSLSQIESARRLAVVLHQATAKNAGGDEWGKAVRDIVKDIHTTADNVFRAVIEDWESVAGYITTPIDVNQELCGGGGNPGSDFPRWNGIVAGVERLTGLIETLTEYFWTGLSLPVSIPLGAIMDMVTRLLSVSIPPSSSTSGQEGSRLHPGVDRDEKDALWCGMPQIYIASLQLVNAIAARLDAGFAPVAERIMDQLLWVFPSSRSVTEFRSVVYTVATRILVHVGQSFNKAQTGRLAPIIRSCCKDLLVVDENMANPRVPENPENRSQGHSITTTQNPDTLLPHKSIDLTMSPKDVNMGIEMPLRLAAEKLLPLLLSTLPQQHLDISLRSLIERTAILAHNKDTMLSSILHPFIGKNGRAMASILPHFTRNFDKDDIVEILLRPRMPLLPNANARLPWEDALCEEHGNEGQSMDFSMRPMPAEEDDGHKPPMDRHAHDLPIDRPLLDTASTQSNLDDTNTTAIINNSFGAERPISRPPWKTAVDTAQIVDDREPNNQIIIDDDTNMASDGESSNDESVHLTMQLDTDSDLDN